MNQYRTLLLGGAICIDPEIQNKYSYFLLIKTICNNDNKISCKLTSCY